MSIFASNDKLILKEIELDSYPINPNTASGLYISEDFKNNVLIFTLVRQNQQDVWQMRFDIKRNNYYAVHQNIKDMTKMFIESKNISQVQPHMVEKLVQTLKERITSKIFEIYATINFKQKLRSEGFPS